MEDEEKPRIRVFGPGYSIKWPAPESIYEEIPNRGSYRELRSDMNARLYMADEDYLSPSDRNIRSVLNGSIESLEVADLPPVMTESAHETVLEMAGVEEIEKDSPRYAFHAEEVIQEKGEEAFDLAEIRNRTSFEKLD